MPRPTRVANTPPMCGMLLKLTGTTWSQFYPTTSGQFDCSPQYLYHVPQSAWGTTLNSQRLATKFLAPTVCSASSTTQTGCVIMPQS